MALAQPIRICHLFCSIYEEDLDMFQAIKSKTLITLGSFALIAFFFFISQQQHSLPTIAIANWGPHASIQDTIDGIQDELKKLGLVENKDFKYDMVDVNFEPSLIMQMLAKLKSSNPVVLVAVGTPVAQAANGSVKDIPIVFTDITSPVEAGLLSDPNKASINISGASDKQDLEAFLQFAKLILPEAKTIGILYATGEANDTALIHMMNEAAKSKGMTVIAIPIEQAKDVPMRMQGFKGKVDFIYVGVSGPIQPSLPAIVSEANKMKIPVFNADADAVKQHQALGSYGVSYYQVGVNTADIIYQILQGKDIATIPPSYPTADDHRGYISKKVAEKLGIILPKNLNNITIVE